MRSTAAMLLILALSTGAAQGTDTIKPAKQKYRYLGIQANLLVQQFISFNSNSSINTNPYVFSFSKNNIQTGAGTVFGTGFNVSQSSTNDGVSSVSINNVNLAFRFGFERKYLQEERFIPFWGLEFAAGGVYTDVTSRLNQSFNGSFTAVFTTKIFAGPSFRGGTLLRLSKHVFLGTEFFFNAHMAYSETRTRGFFSNNSDDVIPINIGFQAPTALFLVFRY
jgi:hypothetical protein